MIKNIILDFGNIFINLDKPATEKEMAQFGFEGLTPHLDTIFKDYEKGTITSNEFLEHTNQVFPKATKQNLTDAWNAILLDFPESRLKFLEKFTTENNYRLFLLSNTNEIHIDWVKNSIGSNRWNRFKNCFKVFYLSHEMGMRKPDICIYQFVLDENNLNSSETFFVDDTKENTESAARLGIKTWNLQVGKEDIIELISHI